MRKIVLVSHGKLSTGILDSAKMILGELKYDATAYELKIGEVANDIKDKIEVEIVNNSKDEYVIVTDLYGASVTTAMYELIKYENVSLFTGMNLNLVLSLFVEFDNVLLSDDNISSLINDSREGIRYLDYSQNDNNDEF